LTDSFTPEEVDKLRRVLIEKYNIESTLVSNGKGKEQSIIRIPKREVTKVKILVEPFMAPSMRYRVGGAARAAAIPMVRRRALTSSFLLH